MHLVEMPRHGQETACCGGGAVAAFPESYRAVRDERLREAATTGAEMLVDVCHFCHQTFASQEPYYPYEIINYVTLVARALGLERLDMLKQMIQAGDVERILEDAADRVEQSPFTREQIRATLKHVILLE